MKKFVMLFTLSIWFIIATLPVFAADTAPAAVPWGDVLSTFLTNSVLPIFGALVMGFASWAATKIGTKYHIDCLLGNNTFVTQIASQGVAFAEEKAANFAKTASPISSNDKLNAAIAYVMQMAPKVTPEQAQSLVTSALAMLPGVGATGDAAVGVITPVVPATPAPLAVTDPLAVAPVA